MDRDTAEKLEEMMPASRAQLENVAEVVRVLVPAPQQRTVMLRIAGALAELIYVSRIIHDEHPHLNPYKEEDALAARMREANDSDTHPLDLVVSFGFDLGAWGLLVNERGMTGWRRHR